MSFENGWIGDPEQLLHVLATAGADRDAEGNFLIFGEAVIAGLTGDVLVPAGAQYALHGKRVNLAAVLASTPYGQSVAVIF